MKSAKIIIFTLLFTLLFVVFTRNTLAFSSGANLDYQLNYWRAINSPEMNLQSFVNETFKGLVASFVNQAIGCLTCDTKGKPRTFGLFGDAANLMSTTYAELPSSAEYFADIGQRLNIVRPSYAQNNGEGYARLEYYLFGWKTIRNLSYSLLALIMVIIGFAVMFRVKLSPQASVTIQSAIPKIVISFILITFSYAIVGFLVDVMLVISNLIITIFARLTNQNVSDYLTLSGFKFSFPATDNFELIGIMLKTGMLSLLTPLIIMLFIGLAGTAATASGFLPFLVMGWAPLVIFIIILVIALVRVLFMLIKAYVNVILGLIFAPIILLADAIPSMNTTGPWIQNIISNLLVFPIVLTLTSLASYLVVAGAGTFMVPIRTFLDGNSGWDWNKLVTIVLPQVASASVNYGVMIFIAPGILLLTPKAVDIIQSFISKKPFAYGTAIGEVLKQPVGWGKKGGTFVAAEVERQEVDASGRPTARGTAAGVLKGMLKP